MGKKQETRIRSIDKNIRWGRNIKKYPKFTQVEGLIIQLRGQSPIKERYLNCIEEPTSSESDILKWDPD